MLIQLLKRPRAENEYPSLKRERGEIHLSFKILVYSDSQWIRVCLPTLVKAIFFTQATGSNTSLFQKYPHRHTQKYVYKLSDQPLIQLSGHEINHYTKYHKIGFF